MSFLEELAKNGLIKESQIDEAKNLAKAQYEGDVDEALLNMGINEEDILKNKGEYFVIPVKNLSSNDISSDVLKYIPEDSAIYYHFVPLKLTDGVLEVGVTNPENTQAIDALQFISAKVGIPFKIFLISKTLYKKVLDGYSGISGEVGEALDQLNKEETQSTLAKSLNESIDLSKEIKDVKRGGNEAKIVEDAPIIKIVAVILKNAIEGNASDIHIEHTGEKVKVRYRVDGTLYTTLTLPTNVHSGIVARIKILSKLRLDEKRKPQDGSFSATIDGSKIDFRVSTMPSYYGEKVVMRILDSAKGVKKLDNLGLSERNLKIIQEAIKKPYGLILITGPTGSGKSTSLYSILNALDKEKVNIVTLEDPIEYHMTDINQSQMMPEIGYTFASGLRSILRQDPNVIMVGEIRDKETAQLAIQAALTGHLVLSTLHTNNAIGAIPRLIDMGVDPYLIAPTLILSIAQRLAKLTFPESRKEVPMDESTRLQIENQISDLPPEFKNEIKISDTMYDVVGVPECPSGTRGRIAIYEILDIDAEIQNVILKNPIFPEIYKAARKKGMLMMREDAMLKAINGIIPYTEVYNFTDEKE